MEAIRISCAGYPTRKPFYEFVDRFGILAPGVLTGRYGVDFGLVYIYMRTQLVIILVYCCNKISSDEIKACKSLLEKVGLEGYQVIWVPEIKYVLVHLSFP